MPIRGVPMHPDTLQAYQLALNRIRTYKGSKPVFDIATRLVVQGIVIDALIVAPQPVTGGWVHTSLMAVGGLVRWAQTNAEPLDRDHLLSERTRNRFLNLGCRHIQDTSLRNYLTRLDLIATALSGTAIVPATTRPLAPGEPVDPHPDLDIATLWQWAQGLRPISRRDRVVATIVVGLGCGLRSSEHILVRREDVAIDGDGVHVTVDSKYGPRLVTCDDVWADRLTRLVDNTRPGYYINSPWRNTPATARGLQNAVRQTQRVTPAIVAFSPRSLRNTWLVERLTYGTPVPTLMAAAGLESIEALKGFLPFVATPTAADRATSLKASRW